MAITCPKCGSKNIGKRNYAKKAVASVGGLAGGATGYLAALAAEKAAEEAEEAAEKLGASIGRFWGVFGAITGAQIGKYAARTLAVLTASTAGLAVGEKAGGIVDKAVLDNNKCLDCSHTFSD